MRPPGTEDGFVDGPGNAAPAVAEGLLRAQRGCHRERTQCSSQEQASWPVLHGEGGMAWSSSPQGSASFLGLPEESLAEITTVDTFHWALLCSCPTTLTHTRVRNRYEHMDKCTPVLVPQPHLCHPLRTEPDSSMDSLAWRGEG